MDDSEDTEFLEFDDYGHPSRIIAWHVVFYLVLCAIAGFTFASVLS